MYSIPGIGWVVRYTDGTIISEWDCDETPFSRLPYQDQIDAVALVYGDRHWVIQGKKHYYAKKGESLYVGYVPPKAKKENIKIPAARTIDNMSIGYWEGGQQIELTLDFHTGQLRGPYEVPRR